MIPTFKDENGFARSDVTLANWRTAPFSRWAFHNVRDLVARTGVTEVHGHLTTAETVGAVVEATRPGAAPAS